MATLQHSEQGSIVFIAGFDAEKKWQHRITATVLSNFFYAIDRGMLEVLIQDDAGEIIEISASTLKKCFSDIMKMQIDEWEVSNSHCYYRAIKEVVRRRAQRIPANTSAHCRMWVLKERGASFAKGLRCPFPQKQPAVGRRIAACDISAIALKFSKKSRNFSRGYFFVHCFVVFYY